MTVLTTSAAVQNGITEIMVRCGAKPCSGAFILDEPSQEPGGRMAASNFSVPANQTQTIAVAVTPLGEKLAASPGGSKADIWVFLHGFGDLYLNGNPQGLKNLRQLVLHD